jgi:uridine phosphorylase
METFSAGFEKAPILAQKHHNAPSVFTPENLLREARRQRGLPHGDVPAVCVLDPDGDLVDYLHASGSAEPHPTWACYHTALATFKHDGIECGILGRVVGAPFAVLVAEELFASGCQLLISVTSAGQIVSLGQPPYVVLIDRALRDEGTSYHYLPPAPFSHLPSGLRESMCTLWDHTALSLHEGASWTTDAPFRETAAMIETCRRAGILAVEMEAAALYALAERKQYDIVCFALVTNQMGRSGEDFEKGEVSGSQTLLQIIGQTARIWECLRHRGGGGIRTCEQGLVKSPWLTPRAETGSAG